LTPHPGPESMRRLAAGSRRIRVRRRILPVLAAAAVAVLPVTRTVPSERAPAEPRLVFPTAAARESFLEALAEYRAEGRYLDLRPAALSDPAAFARWVDELRSQAREDTPRPPSRVPTTVLWWVAGDTYLGRLAIRHRLNAGLRQIGGHIGYDVRPSARGQGHGTAMLQAALPFAARLGIDPALVTCDRANVASRRVIEAAGGRYAGAAGRELHFEVPTRRR